MRNQNIIVCQSICKIIAASFTSVLDLSKKRFLSLKAGKFCKKQLNDNSPYLNCPISTEKYAKALNVKMDYYGNPVGEV